eukprot:gene34100-biopygen12349
MLEPRGQLEQEPGSSQHGGADAQHAKLQFVEDTVYQAADGVVADEVLQQRLNDFDKNRGKAVLSAAAKSAANADARVVKDHQDQRWKKKEERNEKKEQWELVQVVLGLEMDLKLASKVTVGSRIEVFWKDDDCFYPVVVKEFNEDGKAHALYDDGDEETLDLSEENFKIICSSGVSELTDETPDVNGEYIDCGGDYKENKCGGAVEQ